MRSYSRLAMSYLNDVPGLGQLIADKEGEGVLVTTGPGKTLRILHQVFKDPDRSWVLDILGIQKYAPLKELLSTHLVKPILIPSSQSAWQKVIPTFKDFIQTESPEAFTELDGTSGSTIEEMTIFPQSTWAHPVMRIGYLIGNRRAASTAHSIIWLMNQEHDDAPAERYHNSLVLFLWGVEQGLVQNWMIYNPLPSQAVYDRLVEINRKIKTLPMTNREDSPSPVVDDDETPQQGNSGSPSPVQEDDNDHTYMHMGHHKWHQSSDHSHAEPDCQHDDEKEEGPLIDNPDPNHCPIWKRSDTISEGINDAGAVPAPDQAPTPDNTEKVITTHHGGTWCHNTGGDARADVGLGRPPVSQKDHTTNAATDPPGRNQTRSNDGVTRSWDWGN
jgi:hypothetical protein